MYSLLRFLVYFSFFSIYLSVYGQSDFDLTQRFFNESIYNPAATGNSFTTSIFLHARAQWVGLDGAPTTQAITADTYVEHLRSAFGLGLNGDQIGFTSTYNVRLSYAYFMPLSEKSMLSLGLSAGIISRNRNASGALVDDLDDPELYFGDISEYSPDFDFGIEYKGPLKLGIAVRHLGSTYSISDFPPPSKNFWGYLSSRFNLGYSSIEPIVSYMFRDKISRIEVGALMYLRKTSERNKFYDKLWFGAMYRLNQQFAILAGTHLSKKMRVGYSFDYGLSDLSVISKYGTHEIFIAWQFDRIFYKEATCPAYKQYDSKSKRNLRNRVKYNLWP